jgi:hypothetical protein
MWVSRVGPGMSLGGESGVHVSRDVGSPLGGAFDPSLVVGEGRRRSLGGGVGIGQLGNHGLP